MDAREQLGKFVYRADELAGTRLVKHGTKATFSIKYDYRTGTKFGLTEPDEEELKACLVTLRQFVSPKEPIDIDRVYNLCEKVLGQVFYMANIIRVGLCEDWFRLN